MAADRRGSVKPFATGDASEWFTRFKTCSKANGWDIVKMARKEAPFTAGRTLAIMVNFLEEEQAYYKVVKEKPVENLRQLNL